MLFKILPLCTLGRGTGPLGFTMYIHVHYTLCVVMYMHRYFSRTQATSIASQVTYLPRPSLPPVFDLFLHTASDQTLLGSEARLIEH